MRKLKRTQLILPRAVPRVWSTFGPVPAVAVPLASQLQSKSSVGERTWENPQMLCCSKSHEVVLDVPKGFEVGLAINTKHFPVQVRTQKVSFCLSDGKHCYCPLYWLQQCSFFKCYQNPLHLKLTKEIL